MEEQKHGEKTEAWEKKKKKVWKDLFFLIYIVCPALNPVYIPLLTKCSTVQYSVLRDGSISDFQLKKKKETKNPSLQCKMSFHKDEIYSKFTKSHT